MPLRGMIEVLPLYCILVLALYFPAAVLEIESQDNRPATPITVNLVTPTPFGISQFSPTVTPTFTLTAPGPSVLQAKESAGRVNVRSAPNTSSDLLGAIVYGTRYPFLRRYFLWYELEYEAAPNGRAWVFSELVEVEGELESVQTITDYTDVANVTVGEGQPAIVAGLGSDSGTETASRTLIISSPEAGANRFQLQATPLPTFTYPPDLPVFAPTKASAPVNRDLAPNDTDILMDLPPLIPIVLLAGFGVVGMMINSIRR